MEEQEEGETMTEHGHSPATAPTVYCYTGQVAEVRKFFERAGVFGPVSTISKAEQLRAMPAHAVFFQVKDHLEPVTEEIFAMLEDRKAVVVEIDNSRVPR
jgi:hypothetical protein